MVRPLPCAMRCVRNSALLLLAALLVGCSAQRESAPSRTATEQLLLSAAAERAADRLKLEIPAGNKVFVDATHFDGYDGKYALGTIRDRLAKRGALLVGDRGAADVIVEVRAGALAMNEDTTLIGLPSADLPFPAPSGLRTPEFALFKRAEKIGVAKFAATGFDPKGALVGSAPPAFGTAHRTRWTVLFVGFTTSDIDDPEKVD
jgi:hypothetical protein